MSVRLRTTLAATVLASTLAATVIAADATLTIGSVGAVPGETVNLPIALGSDDLVGAFSFKVDASGLMIADVAYDGPLFGTSWEGWDNTPIVDASVAAACIFPRDQVTGHDIHLLGLLIEVPADAKPNSEIAVRFIKPFVSDYSGDPYKVTVIEGSIVIVSDTCDEDVDGDGSVNFRDLLAVIAAWGPCKRTCDQDVDRDGMVGLTDLLRVLAVWGKC